MSVTKHYSKLRRGPTLAMGRCPLACDKKITHITKVSPPASGKRSDQRTSARSDKGARKDSLNVSYAVSVQGVQCGVFEDEGGSDVESVHSSDDETTQDEEASEDDADNFQTGSDDEGSDNGSLSGEELSDRDSDRDDESEGDEVDSDDSEFGDDISVVSGPSTSIHRRAIITTTNTEQDTLTEDTVLVTSLEENEPMESSSHCEGSKSPCKSPLSHRDENESGGHESEPGYEKTNNEEVTSTNTDLDMDEALNELETLLSDNSKHKRKQKPRTSNLQTLFEQLKASCPAKIVPTSRLVPDARPVENVLHCARSPVTSSYKFGLFAKQIEDVGGYDKKNTDVDSGLSTNVETSSTDSNESCTAQSVIPAPTKVLPARHNRSVDRSRPYPTRRPVQQARSSRVNPEKSSTRAKTCALSSMIDLMKSECKSQRPKPTTPRSAKILTPKKDNWGTPKSKRNVPAQLTPGLGLSKLSLNNKPEQTRSRKDDTSLMCSTPVKGGATALDISMISAIHALDKGSSKRGTDSEDIDDDLHIIDEPQPISPPKTFKSPKPKSVKPKKVTPRKISKNVHGLLPASAPAKMKEVVSARLCNETFIVQSPSTGNRNLPEVTTKSPIRRKPTTNNRKNSPRRLLSTNDSPKRRIMPTFISPPSLKRSDAPPRLLFTSSPLKESKADPYAMSSDSDNSDAYELYQEFEEQVSKNKKCTKSSPFKGKSREKDKRKTDGLLAACGLYVHTPVSPADAKKKKVPTATLR